MATSSQSIGKVFRRPTAQSGLLSWITTVDHKRIGIMYAFTALFFLVLGGIEALVIRLQLAGPNLSLVEPEFFNQLFTMHGTTMIFLAVMPLSAAFINYLLPLMIGARDVAFPRLNAFSYWIYLLGGLFLNSSWLFGAAPNAAWTGYAPLTLPQFSPGLHTDFWLAGLQLLGLGTLVSGFNFIVTIFNMRAPGMTLLRMPVFVWTTLIMSFLVIMSFPSITIALFLIMFDRMFGTHFFNIAAGADISLWQHLFWVFGHPEVYILIMPAMGIISEVLPTFSRKPLFGYPVMVFSTVAIGFMGFSVWSHHMFTIGMGAVANAAFALTTMTIAIPTGVKIFNWLGTLWGGSIRFTTPMLYALGFLSMFVIGGLSGVMHSAAPANTQQHDTYFVVAHFHYVLIGGALFGILAGLHYWFPKVTRRLMSEKLGAISFVFALIGFNLTFFPHHILGLNGMPRRIYTYDAGMGWETLNLLSTIGAFILAVGFLFVLINFFVSLKRGKPAGDDPWDARTIEWMIPSPPPVYNFAVTPRIHTRDEFWARKYQGVVSEEEERQLASGELPPIHMPAPSYYPLLLSIALTIAAYGVVFGVTLMYVGLALTLLSIIGWAFEGVGDASVQPKGLGQ